ALRAKLAAETDRRQRFRYYDELRDIGNALVPLERELRDAGIPARTVPPQPAA
ncbi:MAG: hypothetical protein JWQ07_1981, partial [Ramlibacter sp.]|nr:hypothetical protein [Ramlibacter sp.]